MPPELTRADYAVSSNVARTIDATRQGVIDVRSCYDWLQSQELLTTSGSSAPAYSSCYGFLTSAHDERIRVNVFNHCSTHFADVVWKGLSTKHIREGIEGQIDIDRLRAVWDCLSPVHYVDRFAAMKKSRRSSTRPTTQHFRRSCRKTSWIRIGRSGADTRSSSCPVGTIRSAKRRSST